MAIVTQLVTQSPIVPRWLKGWTLAMSDEQAGFRLRLDTTYNQEIYSDYA